jgi:hypothetical protein
LGEFVGPGNGTYGYHNDTKDVLHPYRFHLSAGVEFGWWPGLVAPVASV